MKIQSNIWPYVNLHEMLLFFLQRISWAHTFCNLNVLHNKIDNLETVHKNWEEEYFTIKGENKKYGRMKHHVILTRYIA